MSPGPVKYEKRTGPGGRNCHKTQPKELKMFRHGVNKHKSANKFKAQIKRTKAPNMKGAPMRGGIRL